MSKSLPIAYYLSRKYNLPEEKVEYLVERQWLGKWMIRYAKIFGVYERNLKKAGAVSKAVTKTAKSLNISERRVYRAIKFFRV